ncbi:hypothetical protein [Pseudomonas sp. NPDC089534]|uniref:hypothetical protein n=1 Tax=Pseudomonas sp. NPDC089534 TaxID=3364468 RepID=UPI0038270DD0
MDAERDGRAGLEDDDLSLINDPGNEDPGSLMDDVLVPLWEEGHVMDVVDEEVYEDEWGD